MTPGDGLDTTSGRATLEGSLRVLLAQSLLPLTGFVTTVFLTRRLGPHEYGLFTLCTSLVGVVEWLAIAPLSTAPVKFVREARDWRPVASAILRAHAALGLIAMALVTATASLLAAVFDEPALARPLVLLAPEALLFALIAAHRVVLVGRGDYTGRAVTSAWRWTVRLFLVLAFVGAGAGVPGAVAAVIGASLAELLACRRRTQPSLSAAGDFRLRSLAGELVWVAVFSACLRLFGNLDLFLLKALGASATQAGLYGAALSVLHGVVLTGSAASPLLLSSLSGLRARGDDAAAGRLAQDGVRAVVLLLPFAALCAPSAGAIAQLLFGPAYAASGPILGVLGFGAAATLLLHVASQALVAAKRPGTCAALGGLLLLGGAAALGLAIPGQGLLGAAAARTGITAVTAALAVALACRGFRVPLPWRSLVVSCLVSAVAWGASAQWSAAGGPVLLKLLVLSLACLAALFAAGELGRAQLSAIARIFER